MNNSLANKTISSLNDCLSDEVSTSFETITFRADDDNAAMINTISDAFRQPVSSMFMDEISHSLSGLLLESKGNQELILSLLGDRPTPGSALAMLLKDAIWEIGDAIHWEPVDPDHSEA